MKIRNIVLVVLVALVSGLGIAAVRMMSLQRSAAFATYGSWRGTANLPLNKDNLVTTQVTLFALFALPSHEAVYLFASNDDKDKGLNGSSSYTIQGNIHDLKAGYWSITAYGKDLYLIPNAANRYSFNNNNLVTDSLGNFKIYISSASSDGSENWLPVAAGANFRLVLRLYQADKDFVEHLENAHLPTIKKDGI